MKPLPQQFGELTVANSVVSRLKKLITTSECFVDPGFPAPLLPIDLSGLAIGASAQGELLACTAGAATG